MAWNDLSISQKSYWMNQFRRAGITSLSDMSRAYDTAIGGMQRQDPYLQYAQAPVYAGGGSKDEETDGIYLGELQPAVVKPNPVKLVLRTDGITKDTPITHSTLVGPGMMVSKGMHDPSYDLLTANCADATGEIISSIVGKDLTSGITTPYGLSKKVRKEFSNTPGYHELSSGISATQSFFVPWYDYRVARDIATNNRIKYMTAVARENGANEDTINTIKNTVLKNSPLLNYRLDSNGNRIEQALGGHKFEDGSVKEKRVYNGRPISLEEYQQMQADAMSMAAVKKALARTVGVAPIVDGKALSSCAYTATDNWGADHREASTKSLLENAGQNGWEVAGPVSKDRDMTGYLYLMINKNGVPDHTNLITSRDAEGNPLITYSQGHAGGKPAPTREEWEKVAAAQRAMSGTSESYEDYVKRMAILNSPEADYKRNKPIWGTPGYETLRFVGNKKDKARWAAEWNNLEAYTPLNSIVLPQTDSPLVTVPEAAPSFAQGGRLFEGGGDEEIPSTPYTGEIRQGKKWTAWDNWKADHPMAMHRIRKAGVLLSDAAKLIPGFRVAETLMSPGTMSDYGDMVSRKYGDTTDDSAADRVSGLATPLGAVARAARPIVKTLEQVSPDTPWVTKVSTFRDKLIEGDRIMNALQFVDDFAKPVGQFKEGGHKIHIKKANRGKFTALKKRTGHSASWFKAHGTPAQKKMAVFALNARKWKHDHGGIKF